MALAYSRASVNRLTRAAATLRHHPWYVVLAGTAVAEVAALGVWVQRIGPSYSEDFEAHYAAAKLLATGHRDTMYSLASQLATLNASGGHGIDTVNHAGWGPVGVASVLPFVHLPLAAAVALWTVLQAVALAGAMVLAVRGVHLDAADRLLLIGVLLAAPGLTALLVLGQWEGLAAVLLVLVWLESARGRPRRSAMYLVALAGALPQLIAGVVVFQVARWGRAQLWRLLAGAAVLAWGSLALLGRDSMAGWLGQAADLGREVRPQDTDGLYGLTSSVLGAGAGRLALTAAASLAAVLCCWRLGRRTRGAAVTADTALGVTGLSLLLSPHLFHYGLTVLAPLVGCALLVRGESLTRRTVTVLWSALGALSVASPLLGSVGWQPAVPLVLVALASVAAAAASWSPHHARQS